MEDVEARFAHLLQPIRDLTKNWEVDVAAQLGEYLEELDQICISFDEGKTTMNFMEAALLIQGSACVYSKKVEYLYSLVYQALDFISGKKRAKQLSSVREHGADGDTSSMAPQEGEDQFLSLDDLPDARTNVDLRSDLAPREILIIPLLPMALVAPDEVEKNVSPLYSCQGEVLASRKDFRMNTCTAHPRGAFMLELVGIPPTETLLPRNQEEAKRAEEQPMEVSACCPIPVLSISPEPGTSPEDPLPAGGGEDEDEEGAAELPEAMAPEVPQEPRSPQQSAAQPSGWVLRERREPASLKETPDPWQSLDPFDSLDSKPFKKGRPYSVPPRVEEVPGQKRKRKGATKLQDFHQWYLAAYADHADSRRPRRKGPSFADMEVLYWKHVREQLETLRRLQRRELGERWLPRPDEGLWPEDDDNLEDSLEDLRTAADDFLEPEEYAEPPEAQPGAAADLEAEAMSASLSYEELVRRNVELFIATSQKFVQETELSQRIREWEDTIQPLLQEQEQHVPFDIHTYGDQVVSRFSQLNQWCPFAELVAGQPAFEVCRSMLASLQLANDYTVEITQQPGLEAAVDTMSLRLLTHQRAHKRFQTYTAPSMAQP
ncbi:condensin-2 complex subunit H2 isoform X1 [Canis lupus baileyi]|uniref:condensin-2 complex subunit H2 isoform X1 n=1 Tax=Canis lupus familiaris TaxID=9615 RepID=UPI00005A207A|nr:condensin-2 complex subunit H2 isoform X1 [Canis lupus familiaris]XP_025310953.1 condensin-2 complex subunit H2 isoform X1 [Canis lupus dingo]XP_038406011.1 condensin-2 complex subunit H2 isoform X1 [Canis lupus familiaris]|eukprot:XP_013972726.1 condensin-2 complex subunit H2 isoform X1 [Canis lupus familiaris]